MHEAPGQPREDPGKLDPGDLGDRLRPANDRHAALVEEVEGETGLPFELAAEILRRVTPLLHRHRRRPGKRLTLLLERGEIADDRDLGMARHGQVRLDADAPGPVEGRVERARHR